MSENIRTTTTVTEAKSANPIVRFITLDKFDTWTMNDIGLFILRAFSILIIFHGIHKASGYSGFVAGLESNPVGGIAPGLFGFLVVAGQLLLGIGLLLGLATRWCAFFLALMFTFIILVVNIPNGGIISEQHGGIAFESSLFYFVTGLALIFTGAGRFSLDHILKRKA